jgi:predicted dienelactone hydrolase
MRASAVLFLVLSIALASCVSGASNGGRPTLAPLRDPAVEGPYRVATLELDLQKTSTTTGEPRPLHTFVWYPADAGGPFPVVVFSHGNGGRPDGAQYLTQRLASWGYIVAAPAHYGNTYVECPGGCTGEAVTDSAANRPADVQFVPDAVLRDRTLGAIASPDLAAVIGYSLGGWTAINATPSGRFAAMVALAPSPMINLLEPARRIAAPSLIMGGGKDTIADPGSAQQSFEAIPAGTDHYLVWFPKAVHASFRDLCAAADCADEAARSRLHNEINRYAVAFLQTYVVGDGRYKQYLSDTADAEVTALK